MALFQKKPQTSSPPLYTLGLNKTIMIVGLGNPGKEYAGTRHNIGFEIVNALAERQDFDPWIEKKDLKCQLAMKTMGNARVILVKPMTFMNLSGEAVQAVSHFYKVDGPRMVVVHDELDIPFGQIRTRVGGSSAGHNGIKSVTQHIGEDYGRLRIGVQAETKMDAKDFVLAKFSKVEQKHLPALIQESLAILTEYIYGEHLPHETRSFML